jgi:hypothetical protein
MVPPIIPCRFVAKGQIGDFAWMLQTTYENSLLIFNDTIENINSHKIGNGNTWARRYTVNNPDIILPLAANIPVASIRTGGYTTLDTITQANIDAAIDRISTLINAHTYDNIYFAALNDDKIATANYTVSSTVRNYITSAINNLS